MRVRVVIANQAEALFYDIQQYDADFVSVATLAEPQARLHDRDLKSDRPGRVFDHAPRTGRHGAVAHHATGGENTPRQHVAETFAQRIVAELEPALYSHHFERLVLIAEPRFLGVLRDAMPKALRAVVALEISKDLVHHDTAALKERLPRELFIR